MRITIELETPPQWLHAAGGIVVPLAARGVRWSRACLGDYANHSGVYVLHSVGTVLYVGQATVGKHGTFGERLRREFHGPSAGHSTLYELLAAQPEPVRAHLLDLATIDALVISDEPGLSPVRKALILEQALIAHFNPPGNRR